MDIIELDGLIDQEAGIYTWDVAADLVYGDTAVAALFGLDPRQTIIGLPLATYIARIHPDDQAAAIASISNAMKDGASYHSEYRVRDGNGQLRMVVKLGRAFLNANGLPAQCTGIVYPIDKLQSPD